MKAGTFAAQDKADVLAKIEVGVIGCAALVQTNDPDVLLLHGFEGARDVNNLGDADVLAGACRGFGRDWGKWRRSTLGKDYAVDAGAVCGTEECTEIVGVLYPVEGEKKPVAGRAGRGLEQIFEGEELALAQEGDDALVSVGAAVTSELIAWLGGDANAFGTGKGENRIEAWIATCFPLAGHTDVIQRARTGSEGLLNRVQAVQNIHRFSVLAQPPSVLADEAGGSAVRAEIEGIDVALALQTPGGETAAHSTLAMEQEYLSLAAGVAGEERL